MRPLLNDVRHAESREDLFKLWDKFKQEYKKHKDLIKYIEKYWINEKKMPTWVIFVREVSLFCRTMTAEGHDEGGVNNKHQEG